MCKMGFLQTSTQKGKGLKENTELGGKGTIRSRPYSTLLWPGGIAWSDGGFSYLS